MIKYVDDNNVTLNKTDKKYTFRGMPIFHSEWAHKYPCIYCLTMQLFEFNYKSKFIYKFLSGDMCDYQR